MDKISDLADTFNKTVVSVKARMTKMDEVFESLEKKVLYGTPLSRVGEYDAVVDDELDFTVSQVGDDT
ncbi:hypothetical protein C8T65DRAFT_663280, partial [Cerioporus squamosus]